MNHKTVQLLSVSGIKCPLNDTNLLYTQISYDKHKTPTGSKAIQVKLDKTYFLPGVTF